MAGDEHVARILAGGKRREQQAAQATPGGERPAVPLVLVSVTQPVRSALVSSAFTTST